MSTQSMDNFHGLSGQFSWTQRTLTMNIVQSTHSNTPMEMSTESMDFLQTGLNKIAHIARHAGILKLFQEFSVYSIKFVHCSVYG